MKRRNQPALLASLVPRTLLHYPPSMKKEEGGGDDEENNKQRRRRRNESRLRKAPGRQRVR
jgi:hypothetical protein